MAERELGRIDRGQHGQLRVSIECDDSGPIIAIAFWYRKEGSDEFAPSKNRITIRSSELLAVGRLLRMAYDTLGKENPFSAKHRAAPVYAGAERQVSTRAASDEPDWNKVF